MDTLVSENYVFEKTISRGTSDADSYLVKGKNFTPYIDQQRGAGPYSSSRVIIDAQTGNTSDVNDWYDAYITLPYQYRLTCSVPGGSTLSAAPDLNFFLTPKNCSLIESMRVEQGGRVIIQDTTNLSHLVNFVKHQTTSASSLNTQTGDIYFPDGEFSESTAAGIAGVRNVSNCPISLSTNTSNTFFNNGALQRQRSLIGNGRLSSAYVNANQGLAEQAPVNAAVAVTTIAASPGTVLSDVHYLAVIYLRDLSDYFMKHPLSKGGYKFTFVVNQATTVLTSSTVTTPFSSPLTLSSTSLVGGSTVQPCMVTMGASNCVNSPITGTSGVYTYTLTSAIDTDAVNARQSGVILWLPSLTLSDASEAKLLAQPVISRTPFMVNSSVYQSLGSNAPINLQLFSAISNPRALIIIPQYSSATGSQTQASQASPFNPSPGVTDPLSLTKLQVRVNSKNILPAPTNFGWNHFIQNTSQLFTVNAGLSDITSGMINLSRWMNNYRYYAIDLSLTGTDQRDIPQLITLEAFNNSSVIIDLYVYVLYEQDVTFNLADATVQAGM